MNEHNYKPEDINYGIECFRKSLHEDNMTTKEMIAARAMSEFILKFYEDNK